MSSFALELTLTDFYMCLLLPCLMILSIILLWWINIFKNCCEWIIFFINCSELKKKNHKFLWMSKCVYKLLWMNRYFYNLLWMNKYCKCCLSTAQFWLNTIQLNSNPKTDQWFTPFRKKIICSDTKTPNFSKVQLNLELFKT